MSSGVPGSDWHARTLRAWQLALLRFAVTLDNADRLAVMAIANEIDRLGPEPDGKPGFGFFRRTSAELCTAILRPDDLTPAILQQYLARIDDDRLKRAFSAAIRADRPKMSSVGESASKPDNGLWSGLSSRDKPQL